MAIVVLLVADGEAQNRDSGLPRFQGPGVGAATLAVVAGGLMSAARWMLGSAAYAGTNFVAGFAAV